MGTLKNYGPCNAPAYAGLLKNLHGLPGNSTKYIFEDQNLFEWSAVQQLCFSARALPLVFANLRNQTAHPLQIERSAIFPEEIVKLDDERDLMREEKSAGAETCPKKGPSLMYGGEESPAPKAKEEDLKKTKLLFSMMSVGKTMKKTATRSGGDEQEKKKGADTEEVGLEKNEEKVVAVRKVVETESNKVGRTERTKELNRKQ